MAYHVTIEPFEMNGPTVAEIAEAMRALAPASVQVDMGCPLGKVLLASLQARNIPATALEKRPRPVLAEVQRIEALSKELDECKGERESLQTENRVLREHLRDLRTLIQRLE